MLDQGTSPQNVTLAGASSGGGLALSILVSLKGAAGRPARRAVMLGCGGVQDLAMAVKSAAEAAGLQAMFLADGPARRGAVGGWAYARNLRQRRARPAT